MYPGVLVYCSWQQSGAVEACWAHNPEVRGSKPRSANFYFIFYSCFSFNISIFLYSPFWNKSQGVRRFVKWKLLQTCPSNLDNHTNKCQNPISNRKRFFCPRVNFPALNTNRLIFRLADKITGRAENTNHPKCPIALRPTKPSLTTSYRASEATRSFIVTTLDQIAGMLPCVLYVFK